MHDLIFYSSYLAIPFLVFLIFFIIKKRKTLFKCKLLLFVTFIFFLLAMSFVYARFVERNMIITKTTKIKTGFSSRVIVVSDLHLGDYKNSNFLKRVVRKINKNSDIDAVLIPGDFVYYPSEDLRGLFSELKNIKFPVYAVLGNHDSEKPGPPIQEKLQKALEDNNVVFLHNNDAKINGKNINVLGLGDKWANEDDVSQINNFIKDDNLIVITHNPDTVFEYKNSIPDLTVTGHTHGGQIRIPFWYKKEIPCEHAFDKGLYKTRNGKVFVTTGLGEVGLPMRLGVLPVIEVLELY